MSIIETLFLKFVRSSKTAFCYYNKNILLKKDKKEEEWNEIKNKKVT